MKFSVLMVVLLSASAHAQSPCPEPSRLNAKPQTVSEFFKAVTLPGFEKGEFETTAEFEKRKTNVTVQRDWVIPLSPAQPINFLYNADHELFGFSIFSLERQPSRALYNGSGFTDPEARFFYKWRDRQILTEVSVGNFETTYVFEPMTEAAYNAEWNANVNTGKTPTVFGYANFDDPPYLTFHVPVDRARQIKGSLHAVMLIEPKFPYLARSVSEARELLDRGTKIVTNVVIGDMKCVGVLDGDGTLLAHWATR